MKQMRVKVTLTTRRKEVDITLTYSLRWETWINYSVRQQNPNFLAKLLQMQVHIYHSHRTLSSECLRDQNVWVIVADAKTHLQLGTFIFFLPFPTFSRAKAYEFYLRQQNIDALWTFSHSHDRQTALQLRRPICLWHVVAPVRPDT